jgi:hypothetical protein
MFIPDTVYDSLLETDPRFDFDFPQHNPDVIRCGHVQLKKMNLTLSSKIAIALMLVETTIFSPLEEWQSMYPINLAVSELQ